MTDVALERPKRIYERHPNASRALTHGSGLGALLVNHRMHMDNLGISRIDLTFEESPIKIE